MNDDDDDDHNDVDDADHDGDAVDNADSNDDNDDSFIEEWLGEYNNPTFWKGVVVAICKLLKCISMNECILINIHTHFLLKRG